MKKTPTETYQLRSKGPVKNEQISTELEPEPSSAMAPEPEEASALSVSGRPPFNSW